MPVCGFVKEFEIAHHPKHKRCLRVSIRHSGNSPNIFSELIRDAFPQVDIWSEQSSKKFILAYGTREHLVVHERGTEFVKSLRNLLKVLERCITIEDGLNESHTLSPHTLVDDDENWRRSSIGNLVYKAKYSYNVSEAEDAAQQIASKIIRFVRRHPRYRRSTAIGYAPSSNPSRTRTLPRTLANIVAKHFRKPLISPIRQTAIPPQKNYEDAESDKSRAEVQHGTIRINQDVRGAKIIVVDDLYESGATMEEVARVMLAEGADEVLGLAVTKNAKFTQGLDLRSWPWG